MAGFQCQAKITASDGITKNLWAPLRATGKNQARDLLTHTRRKSGKLFKKSNGKLMKEKQKTNAKSNHDRNRH